MKNELKAILIDDEQLSLDTLSWQLNEFCPDIVVVKTFTNPLKAVNYLERNTIDLCFLDIDMPEMNGFEFLNQLKSKNFDVIFVTAYSEYAIKAFKVSAFDYLLKPIDEEELVSTIRNYKETANNSLNDQLNILVNEMAGKNNSPRKIALNTSVGMHFVEMKHIIHLEADKNYTTVHIEKQAPLIISKTLKEVEKTLDESYFFRIHQSHTINIDKIEIYHKGRGGSVTMSSGDILPVSKEKKDAFLEKLGSRL